MRRTLIQLVLPLCFCLFPALAGALIVVATPPDASRFYLERIRNSVMD